MTLFNVKNLSDAVSHLGNLVNRDFSLILWVDSKPDCTPIVRIFRLVIPSGVSNKLAKDILEGINSKAWILAIMDEHRNVYRLTDAEDYSKKSCKEVKNDGKPKK